MPAEQIFYFAYGSNMSVKRLRARTPSARKVGVATLKGHALQFHKISRLDGSAKCDVKETGTPDDMVYGVVFVLDVVEKPLLDQKEGLGCGYEQKQVSVEMQDGRPVQAYTYYATLIDSRLKPYDWYKAHVLMGAGEHGLPSVYVRNIEAIESIADPDIGRQEQELAIYR